MTTTVVLAAAVLVLVGVLVGCAVLVIGHHPRRPRGRDETLRAGAAGDVLSPQQAALRAGGRKAWMRPGGF